MRIVRFRHRDRTATGVIGSDGGVVDLSRRWPELDDVAGALHARARPQLQSAAMLAGDLELDEVQLLPPLAAAARLFCIGINYRSHATETARQEMPQPSVFIRTAESVVGHGEALAMPPCSEQFDYEGELAVVIGSGGRAIAEPQALQAVAGYTCFNDGSVRDFQKHSVTAGKNFDRSGACGPWISTADELPDPAALELSTWLNGTEVQHASTELLIHSVPAIVAYVSQFAALRCGDLIATGTPGGVGARRTPPLWMKPGDVIEVCIGGIGSLRNTVGTATPL
jgi:2-keto-4-pentenoate hydratase/2-oxohepta-3-ene-1,7-dioic acid hydratase in catechol pathway